MEAMLSINLTFGRKVSITTDTYQAIKRALPILSSDEAVARYAAAPHEGVTPEVVAAVRSKMIIRGELPARAHSRRIAPVRNHG